MKRVLGILLAILLVVVLVGLAVLGAITSDLDPSHSNRKELVK